MKRLIFSLLGLAVAHLPLARALHAQAPNITRVLPRAARPGKTVDVTLHGEHLTGPTTLWTSFPGKVELTPGIEKNAELPNRVTYRLTLPRSLEIGFGALRLATDQGASALQLFMLDDLPSMTEAESNHSLQSAQQVTLPVAIDGFCDALHADYFTFDAVAGQRLSIDVVAQRLGSQLDAEVRLLDTHGNQLAYADDDPSTGADSRLAYTFTEDKNGKHFIVIRDIRHQGGDGHFYRLRLGGFPLTSVAFPLGGRSESITTFDIVGPAVNGIPPVAIQLPGVADKRPFTVGVQFPGVQGSGYVSVVAGTGNEVAEVEPNDQMDGATKISLPCNVNGRFQQPQDRDHYQFDVTEGQRFVFTGRTRELGSPSDLFMRLYDADANMLVEIEDSDKNEGEFSYTFSKGGTYRLMVEDLFRNGGPQYVYRIEMKSFEPGFALSVEKELFNVPQGGTLATQVTVAERRDYGGPITLSVEGIGDDVILEGNVIPKDKDETKLKVTLPSRITTGQLLSVRVVGKAKIGEREFEASAGTRNALGKVLPHTPFPPPVLDGLISIGVGPVFPDFFELAVDSGQVYFPQLVGTSAYRVNLKRLHDKFKDPISLVIEGLPEGMTAEVKPVGGGEAEYEVTQKGPEDITEGTHPIRIIGTGTFQNQTRRVVLDNVPLVVVKPLLVAVEPAGPIAAGGQQTVKVRITRFGEEKNPVSVRWKEGATGISAPIQSIIPGDKNEVDIVLTATAEAPPGTHDNLVVVATTKVKGQDVVVESPAVSLVIQE